MVCFLFSIVHSFDPVHYEWHKSPKITLLFAALHWSDLKSYITAICVVFVKTSMLIRISNAHM